MEQLNAIFSASFSRKREPSTPQRRLDYYVARIFAGTSFAGDGTRRVIPTERNWLRERPTKPALAKAA